MKSDKYWIYKNEGSAFIVSLWVMLLLIVLVIGMSYRHRMLLKITERNIEKVCNEAAAEIGILAAKNTIMADNPGIDSTNEIWRHCPELFKDYVVDNAVFTIISGANRDFYGISDEQSRLNLNYAAEDEIKRYFEIKELPDNCYAKLVDFIRNRRSEFPAERDVFRSLKDIKTTAGFTEEEYTTFIEGITVYGDGGVNINTAEKSTLLSLGFSGDFVKSLAEFIAGDDRAACTEDDNFFSSISEVALKIDMNTEDSQVLMHFTPALRINSSYFRVNSEGTTKGSVLSCNTLCILKRGNGKTNVVYKESKSVVTGRFL
jgi:hypothetical protein